MSVQDVFNATLANFDPFDVPGKASANGNLPHLSFSVHEYFLVSPSFVILFCSSCVASVDQTSFKEKGKVNCSDLNEAVKIIQLQGFLSLRRAAFSATNSSCHISWSSYGKIRKMQVLGYSACLRCTQ